MVVRTFPWLPQQIYWIKISGGEAQKILAVIKFSDNGSLPCYIREAMPQNYLFSPILFLITWIIFLVFVFLGKISDISLYPLNWLTCFLSSKRQIPELLFWLSRSAIFLIRCYSVISKFHWFPEESHYLAV